MAFATQLKSASQDCEVWLQTVGEDPLFYGNVTVGLWDGGDVLAIDESEQATLAGTLNIWTAATDPNIAGVSNKGTRDPRITDLVALYGRADLLLTGEKMSTFKYGKIRVRVANDATEIKIGDILQVAEDSITIEEVATQVVSCADNMAWEAIATTNPSQADIIALHTDLSQVLGWATKELAATPGDNIRTPLIMMLQPYRLLVSE